MKLVSIQIENFRSIVKTQQLNFGRHLTAIIGQNNDGKSNLLRAIVLAMECLRGFRGSNEYPVRITDNGVMRLPIRVYNWENDFPQALQKKTPNGHTILTITFELSSSERVNFKKACGNAINADLPIQITVGTSGARFKVRKPGKGAKSYENNSIKIARFVSENFEFAHIPAIRPGQMSLEVISNLLERELAVLAEDQQYKDSMNIIEQLQRPVYERLEANVQQQLHKFLPSVKKVKIVAQRRQNNYASRFRTPELIIDDGSATPLEAKGDGIKSLAAISLMRASQTGSEAANLVVAIEEPESHLHPGAIRELATVIHEMARVNQVIITTHSPLLVTRNRINMNIIVSKSQARPASSIKELRDTLGVRVDDNLMSAEYVVLVEGKTDIKILSSIFAATNDSFSLQMMNGKIVFDDLAGAGNIVYKLSTLTQAVTTQFVIVDDDKSGREADKKAGLAGLDEKYRFTWRRPPKFFGSTELEDLIDPDLYWSNLENRFGVKLDRADFLGRKDTWSERMKATYESGGKRWSSSVESQMKDEIARAAADNPTKAVIVEYRDIVDRIVGAIVAIMESA
jgi:putative ATP-dependent endonuclease of the OLD family